MDVQRFNLIMGQASRPSVPWKVYFDNLKADGGAPGRDYLKARGLNGNTATHFKLGFTDAREIAIPVFKNGDLVDYKFRNIDEKKFRRHSGGETWVVNEEAFKIAKEEKKLICVEGEFDAMALYQLGFDYVVSTTGGAQGPTPWLNEIDKDVLVYICYDNDEPGQEAAVKLADRIGIDKCLNMVFKDAKDANEFLLKGGTKEQFEQMMDEAKKFNVEGILRIQDVIESLEKNKIQRVPTFLERLTSHLNGGIPRAGIVTISGREKAGKSSLLMNLCINHAKAGLPTLLISLENDLYFTVQRLLEILVNKPYAEFTEEDFYTLKSTIADLPLYLDVSLGDWNIGRIEKTVSQMKRLYGIEIFGFDHLQYLSGDEVKDIDSVMRRLKMMSRNLNIITYLVSHINRSGSQDDYPESKHLKGSSSIGQEANALLFMVSTKNGHEISIDLSRMSRSKLKIPVSFEGTTGVITDDMARPVMHYGDVVEDIVANRPEISLDKKEVQL